MTIDSNLVKGGSGGRKRFHKWVIYPLVALVVLSVMGVYLTYWVAVKNNLRGDVVKLYVPTGSTFEDLVYIMERDSVVYDISSFVLMSRVLGYDSVYAGYYELKPLMNNVQIVRRLQLGRQSEIKLIVNRSRTRDGIVKMIDKAIEADSIAIVKALTDDKLLSKYGVDDVSLLPMIVLPDTYFIYWTDTPELVLDRLHKESVIFWTDERKAKADSLGLSLKDVVTIASIISLESNKADELPTVAGVYLNRLKKGMLLQADPTVLYAVGDWTIKRVKGEYLRVNSPYNTYRYKGLPPTPISFPPKVAIDAVLNAKNHDYLYFCAKDDFSGYHSFAKNYGEHKANAKKYHKALNERSIK